MLLASPQLKCRELGMMINLHEEGDHAADEGTDYKMHQDEEEEEGGGKKRRRR